MPAVNFVVQWPDGKEESCYSPSTIIYQFFKAGDQMPLSEFLIKSSAALNQASDRVAAKFGYHCSSANDQLSLIKQRAEHYQDQSQTISIVSIAKQN